LINDKLGSNIDACINCISAAVREILQEEKERAYEDIADKIAEAEAEAEAKAAAAEQLKERKWQK
jgi:hypothetical protein